MKAPFLLTPGRWVGEGMIELSQVEEKIPFIIRWSIPEFSENDPFIETSQEIQFVGHSEKMVNYFSFFNIEKGSFSVILENDTIEKVMGKGLIKGSDWIGWEFKENLLGFDGYEYYQRKGQSIIMEAEYSTSDDLRTGMRGKIWKATKTSRVQAQG